MIHIFNYKDFIIEYTEYNDEKESFLSDLKLISKDININKEKHEKNICTIFLKSKGQYLDDFIKLIVKFDTTALIYNVVDNSKHPSSALVALDVGIDIYSNIAAGLSWQKTTASALVTLGLDLGGAFVAVKVGAMIGTAIGGVPGMIIGFAGGVIVGLIIDGIFNIKIGGYTIAGHIKNGVEWIIESIF